jgi:Transcriptional Coactivator p15 (PC4)
MGVRRPELIEPVVVDKWWVNRRHDAIVATLQSYLGHNLIDLRKHAMGRDGVLKPTSKGITIKVTRLRDLQKAIEKSIKMAEALGLIDAEGNE